MAMELFKPKKILIQYDTIDLDKFEIESKVFHLSGNFKSNNSRLEKKEFAENIISCKGVCRGYKPDNGLSLKKTDYFVIGKGEYQKESDGQKYLKTKEWNKDTRNNFIPIISQEHCEELVYQHQQKPRP